MIGNPRANRFLVTTREEVIQMEQSSHEDTIELEIYFRYEDDCCPPSPSDDLTDLEVADEDETMSDNNDYDDFDYELGLRHHQSTD